jgi:hypothetical protein
VVSGEPSIYRRERLGADERTRVTVTGVLSYGRRDEKSVERMKKTSTPLRDRKRDIPVV